MKILNIEEYTSILYKGLVDGEDYTNIEVSPYQLSEDSCIYEKINVNVTNTFFEINNKVYYTTLARDNNNNVVFNSIKEW